MLTVPLTEQLDWYKLEVFGRGIAYDTSSDSLCIHSLAFQDVVVSNDYIHHILSHWNLDLN